MINPTDGSSQRSRRHKSWFLRAATVLVCWIPTSAPADSTNEIKQVREALGGPAWDHVQSLAIDYSFVQGTKTGTVHRLEDVQAGRFVTTYHLPSRTTSSGFDGINSWDQNSGVYYAYGDVDSALAAQNESYRAAQALLYPERHAAVIATAREATNQHKHYHVLRISPEGGRPFELWLDPRSHLPARIIEQGAEQLSVTDLGDYRRVDGIMVPGTIISDGEMLKATQVLVNVRIADAEFAMPRASRPLHPFDSEVKVPIRIEGGRIVLPLTIDGQGPFDCEFDSGGGFILSPSAAVALKLAGEGISRAYGGGEGFTTTTIGMTHSVKI